MSQSIHIVINPGSGQERAPLETLGEVLNGAGAEWAVSVIKQAGDGARLARQAIDAGADVVAAYGGDGTVSDVAGGLVGSDVPLAILPGGTANVVALVLGIPADPAEACRLFCEGPAEAVPLDILELDDGSYSLLQFGAGLHTSLISEATREQKKRFGKMAYLSGIADWLSGASPIRFHLQLDGATRTCDGVACLVCNAGRIGWYQFALSPDISMDDGLLDVVVFQEASPASLLALLRDLLLEDHPTSVEVAHWQARSVRIEADPPQPVQRDGCSHNRTPCGARVVPGAVRVLRGDPA